MFGIPPGLFHDAAGFLLGLAVGGVLLFLHIPVQLFRLVPQAHRFRPGLLGQLPFFFGDLAVIFRVGDHVLKADGIVGKQVLGFLDQVFRQAQAPGNFKSVGFSRHTDGKPVGGPQSRHVKFHAGVFHALGGQGVGFQLAVMGGGRRAGFDFQQGVQDHLGQGRALGGVGARA